MINIEKEPAFTEYKRCTSCKEDKYDVEYFNFDNKIIRLCRECRVHLVELLNDTL